MRFALFLALLVLVGLGGCTSVTSHTATLMPTATSTAILPTPTGIANDAATYLQEAFDFVQNNFVGTKSINWSALHTKVFVAAQHAQTSSDTYPAIQLLIASLKSLHSYFQPPQPTGQGGAINGGYGYHIVLNPMQANTYIVALVFPGSPAEKGGLQVGDVILSQNQTADQVTLHIQRKGISHPIDLNLQRGIFNTNISPMGYLIGKHVGYINIPGFIGDDMAAQAYVHEMQARIQSLDSQAVCGWIVDVRQNTGGEIYPMVAGIGPILGDGQLGTFITSHSTEPWAYANGIASENGLPQVTVINPYHTIKANPPVALLTSQVTSSAGEAVVISFVGRENTNRIGEPTTGVPVGTATQIMPDQAEIVLTAAYEADRTGHSYGESPIPPEQAVTMDWTRLRTSSDPTIQAGLKWLQERAGCIDS